MEDRQGVDMQVSQDDNSVAGKERLRGLNATNQNSRARFLYSILRPQNNSHNSIL